MSAESCYGGTRSNQLGCVVSTTENSVLSHPMREACNHEDGGNTRNEQPNRQCEEIVFRMNQPEPSPLRTAELGG